MNQIQITTQMNVINNYLSMTFATISISLGAAFTPRFMFYLSAILVVALLGILKYSRLSIPYKMLVQLIILSFITETSTRIMAYGYGQTYPIYHFFLLASAIYHFRIYSTLLPKLKAVKWLLTIYLSSVLIIEIVTITIQGSLSFFPSLGLVGNSFFLVIFGLLLFRSMLRTPKPISIFIQPAFWFNAGTMFFYSITFFVFGYFKQIMDASQSMPEWCYSVIRISNFILLACYFLAIFFDSKFRETTHEPR